MLCKWSCLLLQFPTFRRRQLSFSMCIIRIHLQYIDSLEVILWFPDHENKLSGLGFSHTTTNWQTESSTSYELGWFSVNRQQFPVHLWQVEGATEIVGVYSVAQWNFLAGYLNCSCLQNKRVLLDTFIVHLSREQTLVTQGAPVWHHELACRKSWRCVRLDYRPHVAEALQLFLFVQHGSCCECYDISQTASPVSSGRVV